MLQNANRQTSGILHQTPQSKVKDNKTNLRQKSQNCKENLLDSKLKSQTVLGGNTSSMVIIPNTNANGSSKMAQSKANLAFTSDSNLMKDISPSS